MKRDWLTLAFGLGLVGVVVALSLRQNMAERAAEATVAPPAEAAPAPAAPPPNVTAVASAPEPATQGTAMTPGPARPTDATAAALRPTKSRSVVITRPSEPVVAAKTEEASVILQVQSDIAGASVFVDREFVGTTPLNLRGLTPGSKQLNVTATGHEGYASTVDLTAGTNRVNVEFMKVRLNTTIPVVHRHAMGSCQGMLAASAKGLSYDTTDKDDAFAITLADLEGFDVDYLKKNLRVRGRGGRTWNFTNNNADALFVFHREVAKAREKLATAK